MSYVSVRIAPTCEQVRSWFPRSLSGGRRGVDSGLLGSRWSKHEGARVARIDCGWTRAQIAMASARSTRATRSCFAPMLRFNPLPALEMCWLPPLLY